MTPPTWRPLFRGDVSQYLKANFELLREDFMGDIGKELEAAQVCSLVQTLRIEMALLG